MCPTPAKKAFLFTYQTNAKDGKSYCDEYFKSNKQRLQCELFHGELKAYEKEQPLDYIRSSIKSVEHRRGTNILILKCGPNGRFLTFLEFDSKKETDEWEEEICKFTGEKYNAPIGLRRVNSEIKKTKKIRLMRTKSTFADIQEENSDPAQSSPSSSNETIDSDSESINPNASTTTYSHRAETVGTHEEGQESSLGPVALLRRKSDTSTGSSELSRPSPLCSLVLIGRDDLRPTLDELDKGTTTPKQYKTKDLQKLVLFDVQNKVCVKSGGAGIRLPGGAYIMTTNDNGPTNARALDEYFRATADTTVELKVVFGARCVARPEENGVAICLKGNEDVQLDITDALQKVCGASCVLSNGQSSSLVVAQINNESIDSGIQEEELKQKLREALRPGVGYVTVHLLPECLLHQSLPKADDTTSAAAVEANVSGIEPCRGGYEESGGGGE